VDGIMFAGGAASCWEGRRESGGSPLGDEGATGDALPSSNFTRVPVDGFGSGIGGRPRSSGLYRCANCWLADRPPSSPDPFGDDSADVRSVADGGVGLEAVAAGDTGAADDVVVSTWTDGGRSHLAAALAGGLEGGAAVAAGRVLSSSSCARLGVGALLACPSAEWVGSGGVAAVPAPLAAPMAARAAEALAGRLRAASFWRRSASSISPSAEFESPTVDVVVRGGGSGLPPAAGAESRRP
jgi:hypothetical protein